MILAIAMLLARGAEAQRATLVLDGLSFLSFEDKQVYAIPPGTKLVFRFVPTKGRSIPFELHPDDFSWPPIVLQGGTDSLRFGLAEPAKGTLHYAADGVASMTFEAHLRVQLDQSTSSGMKDVVLQFTTDAATAKRLDGVKSIAVSGMRIPANARAIQLVATRTNQSGDYPEPGAAVYAVLSGVFDSLPQATAVAP